MLQYLLAIAAGALTAGAPCILPMLPIILGSSVGQRGRLRPVFIAAGFTLAFAGVALLFGLFADLLGLDHDTLRDTAVLLLAGFGLLMIWPRPFAWVTNRMGGLFAGAGAIAARAGDGNLGGLVLGAALGVLWTPCAGPVLGSILTLIATAEDVGRAGTLLLAYAIGAGIPMLAIAYGGQIASTRVNAVARYSRQLQQAFGAVVILIAAAIHYQYDSLITVWLSQFYPDGRLGL